MAGSPSRSRSKTAPHIGGEIASWAPIKGETLSWRIAAQIRSALFAGQITAGERLGSEQSLAERFGVSRMAMRDALRSLEAVGIVDIRVGAKGGVYIAQGNPERFADALAIQLKLIGVTVEEIFDAQIAIEVNSAELAAARATADDIAKLRALLDELRAVVQAPSGFANVPRFTDLSLRFHETLVEASHNRVLLAQFKALRLVLEPLHHRHTTLAVAERVLAGHEAVLACIEAGDAEGARAHLHKRLQTVRARQLMMTADVAAAAAD